VQSRSELIDIAANRGASGIDGTIASAVGYAAALNKPVTLVVGDLALLHDLNSLSLAAQSSPPLTIIVLNNNGGRIFEHLSIAKHDDVFERYFATPHDIKDFSKAVNFFGLDYHRASSSDNMPSALQTSSEGKRSAIVELEIDYRASVKQRQTLRQRISQDLDRRFA
ncbi:2-succinyl-5-enolpyruvyl-6-hydroxy-3-cyclohexene-1-carboxylate synthase, partial [candidate division GN15 bacterium]|nr:2-succinyl-5-enolpyruvyl-6-hydroxy-3-cyclohexene-1-carboxylate synthase [candidate division GN15 bacterium]